MKKIFSLVLVFALVLAVLPMSVSAAGEPDTAWYYNNPTADEFYIGTVEELLGLAHFGTWFADYVSFAGKTIYLTADLDLGDVNWVTPYTSLSNYNFQGTFDGQGHFITNLNGSSFFGAVIGCTLRNFNIVDAKVYGYGIMAQQCAKTGLIENCFVSGKLTGMTLGGITGLNNGVIRNCVTMLNIDGSANNSSVGGICLNNSGEVSSCVAINESLKGYSGYTLGRIAYTGSGVYDTNYSFEGTIGKFGDIANNPNDKNGGNLTAKQIVEGSYIPAGVAIPGYLAYHDCDIDGHDFSIFVESFPPTCENDGYDVYKCSFCGETENFPTDPVQPALGHDFQFEKVLDNGDVQLLCSRCDETTVKVLVNVEVINDIRIEEVNKGFFTVTFDVLKTFENGDTWTIERVAVIEKNGSGAYDFGYFTLIYDIKGNGSSIKMFRLELK